MNANGRTAAYGCIRHMDGLELGKCRCGEPVYPMEPGVLVQKRADAIEVFCAKHALKVRPKKATVKRPFRLTKDERKELMKGENPTLTRDKEPTFSLPYTHPITSRLSITLTMATKKLDRSSGKWSWHFRYFREDQGRDVIRLLRRTPQGLPGAHAKATTDEQAAEESAYTSSRKGAIEDAGEAVPREYENVLSLRAKERQMEHEEADKAEELARRQARAITESTRSILIQSARMGVDVSDQVAAIHRALEEAQSELSQAA